MLKILQGFESISLEEMDAVALLDRHDTKYVFHIEELDSLLAELASEYRVLEINGFRSSAYESLYFDSQIFTYYDLHQRGKRNRIKIRMRKYCSTGVTFLEVKFKTNTNRTIKYRKQIEDIRPFLNEDDMAFIKASCGEQPEIKPALHNAFERITLVHKTIEERLTIDRQIRFESMGGGKNELPQLVIAELKQATFDRESHFARLAKMRQIRPYSISKYCLGVGLLVDHVRKNLINQKIRAIQHLAPHCPTSYLLPE